MHRRPDDGSQRHAVAELVATVHEVTRRRLVQRLGGLLGWGVVLGIHPLASDAKRKKKKKKSLKASDWNGFWATRLSNGVYGTVNLSYDNTSGILYGTYSNTVGNGELRCYTEQNQPFSCAGGYDQTDGSTGTITMTLANPKRWTGTFQITGGESGTWSGGR